MLSSPVLFRGVSKDAAPAPNRDRPASFDTVFAPLQPTLDAISFFLGLICIIG